MDIVYIETTVVGNIAGRMHPNPDIASRQRMTRAWWITAAGRYRLVTSSLTLEECGAGDSVAALERLEILNGIPLLNQSSEAEMLAELLINRKAVPASEPRDALHIATAAANGVQFIATWNFKHILNPHLQAEIASVCRDAGFIPPVICTPEQLKMIPDPNEEILEIKRRLAARFNNEVHRIAADVRKSQVQAGREVISLPPRRCSAVETTNNATQQNGGS